MNEEQYEHLLRHAIRIERRLDRIEQLLTGLYNIEIQTGAMMADNVNPAMAEIIARVTRIDNVQDSAKAALDGITEQLRQAAANAVSGMVPISYVTDLLTGIEAHSEPLSVAVAANTGAPPPAGTPVPEEVPIGATGATGPAGDATTTAPAAGATGAIAA